MDAHDFLRYLEQPELLASTPFAELERLTEQYPYFSNLHLLVLLKARREQHPKLGQYLSQFAAATFDRPHLYNLLQRLDLQADEIGDTLELIALEELELTPLPVAAAEELPSRLNEITVATPPPPAPAPPAPVPPRAPAPRQPASLVKWVDTAAAFSESLPLRPPPPPLREGVRDSGEHEPPGPQALAHFLPIVRRYGQPPPLRSRLERLRQQSTPGADGPGQQRSAAEPAVSETLADLLVRQEQYGYALRMYERLQLLYPEKKAIFAARIQELKEKF
ncbi:hypothetical protein [Neolewinella sp.]|uniref:hypothetical protein n=1 Tax=Neolewinella sp. TaxID=2993543 RepID=UPI003B52337F